MRRLEWYVGVVLLLSRDQTHVIEDFADAVAREVREETGVESSLAGVVSMRHMHGVRFGQGDLYVVVKLRAEEDAITVDAHDAGWCSRCTYLIGVEASAHASNYTVTSATSP